MTSDRLHRRAARHRALGDPHRLAIVDALWLSDRTPTELSELTGLGSNLVAFHLGSLEAAGIVRRTTSEGDARRRYVRLATDALDDLIDGGPAVRADRILFVCTRNASRSQLAAALWRARTGRTASSAGRQPAGQVDPVTVEVAAQHGLDLAVAVPRGYDAVAEVPDLVVSVCDRAGEATPPFDAPRLHWSVPDPVGGTRADVEAALAELRGRVDVLATRVAA